MVRTADRAEKLPGDKPQDFTLPGRQCGNIHFTRDGGGNNSVMVADLRAVTDLTGVELLRNVHTADRGGDGGKRRDGPFHIVCQESAVGAGISAEFLFIERLQIVERLLGRVAEQSVGVALERGQVVERGRLLGFFFALHGPDGSRFAFAGVGHRFGLRLCFQFVAGGGEAAAVEDDRIERLWLKCRNFRFPLHKERQRWGHDAPDVQGTMV